jgi:hypothetical protein
MWRDEIGLLQFIANKILIDEKDQELEVNKLLYQFYIFHLTVHIHLVCYCLFENNTANEAYYPFIWEVIKNINISSSINIPKQLDTGATMYNTIIQRDAYLSYFQNDSTFRDYQNVLMIQCSPCSNCIFQKLSYTQEQHIS